MKTLYLLRHAKSSWKDDSLADAERPLKGRGRKASRAIGNYLNKEKIVPDLVLSSSAVRARQTTDIVIEAARLSTDLRFDERIYEANALLLLEIVRRIEKVKKTVLLIGHNPGLEEFLGFLTGTIEHLPTGTLAKVVLKDSNWAAVDENTGTVEWVVRPKKVKKK